VAVRIILALLGLFLVGYAISDDPFYGGAPGFGGTQAFIALLGAALLVVAAIGPRPAGPTPCSSAAPSSSCWP
jgi:hypothetical protein